MVPANNGKMGNSILKGRQVIGDLMPDETKYNTSPTPVEDLLQRMEDRIMKAIEDLRTEMRQGFAELRTEINALSDKFDNAQKEYWDNKTRVNKRLDNLERITGTEQPTRPFPRP